MHRHDQKHAGPQPASKRVAARNLVRQGHALHQRHDYESATAHYQMALEEEPKCAEAWHLLGFAQLQAGELDGSLDSLRRAIELEGDNGEYRLCFAVALLANGQFTDAAAQVDAAKQSGHNDPAILMDLGYQFLQRQEWAAAQECFQLSVSLNERAAFAFNCLGVIARATGELQAARGYLERALYIAPSYAEAHNNLGNVWRDLEDWARAKEQFKQAIAADPELDTAHVNLANMDMRLGNFRAALEGCQHVLARDPNSLLAMVTAGNVYLKIDDAVHAIECYQTALQIEPQASEVLSNLSVAQRLSGNLAEAIQSAQRAVQIRTSATGLLNLSHALADAGRIAPALESLIHAESHAPECAEIHLARAKLLRRQGAVLESLAGLRRALQCDVTRTDTRLHLADTLVQAGDLKAAKTLHQDLASVAPHSIRKFQQLRVAPDVLLSGEEGVEYRKRVLKTCLQALTDPVELGPAEIADSFCHPPRQLDWLPGNLKPLKQAYANVFERHPGFRFTAQPFNSGPPKIGLVIAPGREASFVRCYAQIIRRLDGQKFNIVLACATPAVSVLRAAVDNTTEVIPLPNHFARAAQAIMDARLSVIVHAETGIDSINYFLPFCRLAAKQCTLNSVPVTSGISTVDDFLSSELTEGEFASNHYTENLVLGHSLLCYRSRPTLMAPSRPAFGLHCDHSLYLCPQPLAHIHPDFDPWLGEILHRDPQGIVAFAVEHQPANQRRLQARLERTLPEFSDRVRFVTVSSQHERLSLIASADVVLDPPHYSDVESNYDSLGLGIPVITCPTEFARGRHALACYLRMSILDFVADSPHEYVETAVRTAADARSREHLAEASPMLFEDDAAIEDFQEVLERWLDESRS